MTEVVSFTAECPRCGLDCTWVSTRQSRLGGDGPVTRDGCECAGSEPTPEPPPEPDPPAAAGFSFFGARRAA